MGEKPNGIVIQKKHIVIAAVIILLLLIGGITLGANWNKWFGDKQPDTTVSETEDGSKPSIELDENAGEYLQHLCEPRYGGMLLAFNFTAYH